MAGRKPVNDNRQKHAVAINLRDDELMQLDNSLNHESRAWFIRRLLLKYLDGDLIQKGNALAIPENYRNDDIELCKEILSDKKNLQTLKDIKSNHLIVAPNNMSISEFELIQDIISDDNKRSYLFQIIKDSRILSEVN